jgi:site-specific DNA-cytosine methylase
MGGQGAKAGGIGYAEEIAPTLKAAASGTNTVPVVVFDARGNGDGKVCPTLTGDHQNRITDYTALAVHQNQLGEVRMGEVANTLNTNANATGRNAPLVATFAKQRHDEYKQSDQASTLRSRDSKSETDLIVGDYIVRRLTPTECERLQGFPDQWTRYGHDGKEISDTQRYKALGNSVAIPCVKYVLEGVAEAIRKEIR